jgi:hypothetical protein
MGPGEQADIRAEQSTSPDRDGTRVDEDDKTPLPPKLDDPAADEALFAKEPWVESPVHIDK